MGVGVGRFAYGEKMSPPHDIVILPDATGGPQVRRRLARRNWLRRVLGFRLELAPIHYVIVFAALVLVALAPGTARVAPPEVAKEEGGLGLAEQAGMNFAGSAFFFAEPDAPPALPQPDMAAPLAEPTGTARPFVLASRAAGYGRALKCLTDAIYYEAAVEPDAGQRAVAQVVLNRVRHPSYPNSVCGVVYQGSERATGCQFSFSCDGSMARAPSSAFYARAARVARAALAGSVAEEVGLATHYHTSAVSPYWAPSLHFLGTVGAHRFYRWRGNAGLPSAFFARYAGIEPLPWPKPRAAPAVLATPIPDPLMLERQFDQLYEEARQKAVAEAEQAARMGTHAANAPATGAVGGLPYLPSLAASPQPGARSAGSAKAEPSDLLPNSGSIRAEYAASGSWKAAPAQ